MKIVLVFRRLPVNHAMLSKVYAELLPRQGHEVVWIVGHAKAERPDAFQTTWQGSVVHSYPTDVAGSGLRGLLKTAFADLRLARITAQYLAKEGADVLQLRNYLVLAASGWAIARLRGVRFVYQVSYPFPESLVEAAVSTVGKASLPRRLFAAMQIRCRQWLIRHSDRTLPISTEMTRQFAEQGIPVQKLFAFPLGTNCPELPADQAVQALRQSDPFLQPDRPVVFYFGTINRIRRLDFLLDVAVHLRERGARLGWLMVGAGEPAELKRLQALIESHGLKDTVEIRGPVSREQINSYLRAVALSVSPIPPNGTFMVSSPTKAVESLALGCPVVGTPIPDQRDLLQDSGGGIVADFEVEKFAQAVLELASDPARARAMGASGMRYVREARSYERMAAEIAAEYGAMIRDGKPKRESEAI